MTDDLKTRWVMVGFCWMAVVILTVWNLNKIASIDKAREKKEIYLMDKQFWNYNAANISRILKKRALLIQEVESSKLGLFEFESNLRNFALRSGLKAIKLTDQPQYELDGMVPVKISFQSTFKQAAKWFDLLKSELPYAKIKEVNIELDEAIKQNKFTVSIYYRYHQSTEESTM